MIVGLFTQFPVSPECVCVCVCVGGGVSVCSADCMNSSLHSTTVARLLEILQPKY